MSNIARRLGGRIRQLRQNLGSTQEQLANRARISTSFLSMTERGERLPHLETLANIARAFQLSLSDLFAGIDKPATDVDESLRPLFHFLQSIRAGPAQVDALLEVAREMFKSAR